MVYSVSISGDGKNFTSVFSGIAASIQVAELPPNKSVSVSEDGKNYTSVFNGIAASIQIADLEKKGNMTLYVSKDGTAFQPNPIYNAATNFHINFPATGGNKEVYVSTDGAAFQQNPIYNAAAKNFFIQLTPITQPFIQKPADGHVKPGGWGGNQDPFTWRVISMQDDPTLFKIVDNNNTNIAHRFVTQQEAQQYIDYEKSIYQKSVRPEQLLAQQPGTIWSSNDSWTRDTRTLEITNDKDKADPNDSKCRLLDVGKPSPTARIDGGENILTGGSPRFYIDGEYQDVEFESEVLVEAKTSQVYLSARSNHQQRDPDGFGGYPLYIDVTEKMMFFKKEETHEQGYSKRLAEVEIPYKEGEWFKARTRITNIEDGKVKMQGWFNDTTTTCIDDGQIECGNDKHPHRKASPFTETGESCFFRVNSDESDGKDKTRVKVRYKNATIRKV